MIGSRDRPIRPGGYASIHFGLAGCDLLAWLRLLCPSGDPWQGATDATVGPPPAPDNRR